MGYLARLPWMPGGYTGGNEIYSSFSKVFGFEPFYGNDLMDGKSSYISAALDLGAALDIKGFETLFRISFNCDTGLAEPAAFSVNGKKYSIQAKNENGDAVFSVLDEAGKPVLEMSADDLLKHIAQSRSGKTNLLPPADLTMEAKGAELRVHLVFEKYLDGTVERRRLYTYRRHRVYPCGGRVKLSFYAACSVQYCFALRRKRMYNEAGFYVLKIDHYFFGGAFYYGAAAAGRRCDRRDL